MSNNVIKQKSYDFALEIIKLCDQLREEKHFVITNQLLKSGTSIGANVEEALAAQSRRDFFNKMSIASKESREANYWLRLIKDSEITNNHDMNKLVEQSEEIAKILTSIVKTGNEERKPRI